MAFLRDGVLLALINPSTGLNQKKNDKLKYDGGLQTPTGIGGEDRQALFFERTPQIFNKAEEV